MGRQYTNVKCYGNSIWYRGYDQKSKNRIQKKIQYSPTLFAPSKEETPYKLVTDVSKSMLPINFDGIKEAKDYINNCRNVANMPSLSGMRSFEYSYLSDCNEGKNIDYNLIRIANIDIEVTSDEESGFPEPVKASQPITAICLKTKTQYIAFACKDYTPKNKDEIYIKCSDEIDLLAKFIKVWQKYDPDIITGWNIKGFDIPYLVNRITKILGEEFARKLSPWGFVKKQTKRNDFGSYQTYEFVGIETLDYIEIYKKIPHKNVNQESYSLNHIASVELGEEKLNYEEYSSLSNLYNENFELFIDYNIHDVRLVNNLEEKLEFIALYVYTAYDAKVNFSDVSSQTVMVDAIAFDEARLKKQVIPPKKDNEKLERFAGAYVYPTQVGKFYWMVTADLTSLYPHLQMQYNISPDTLQQHLYESVNIDSIVYNGAPKELTNRAKDNNACVAGNGHFFTNEFVGLLPGIQKKMFADRKIFKKKMLEIEEILSKMNPSHPDYKKLKTEASKYNNLQLAKKLQLNSIYGASGNEYFRYYDTRIAEAITKSGQLTIKRIAHNLNQFLRKETNNETIDFIIAGDTDSVMLNLGPVVDMYFDNYEDKTAICDFLSKYFADTIEPFIENCFISLAKEMNCKENKMNMKREKIGEVAIYTAKKRYAILVWDEENVRYSEPKLKIAGLETNKSSIPTLARKKIKDGIMICLQKSERDIQKFIKEFKLDVLNGKYSINEIASSMNINDLNKYSIADIQSSFKKGTPFHVRGAIVHNNLITRNKLDKKIKKINSGDKVKVIKLLEPNKFNSYVLSYSEFIPKEFQLNNEIIDYRKQFETIFGAPMRKIVSACAWSDVKQNSLKFI